MLFFLSCKKECHNTKNDVLKGKIKTIKFYGEDTIFANSIDEYFYNYDTISGGLQSIDHRIKIPANSIDSLIIGAINIIYQSNNTILVYDRFHGTNYFVKSNGKQILSIDKETFGLYEPTATLFFKNNKIDSIYDTGFFAAFISDIKYNGFIYDSIHNCISYHINWIENYTGSPVEQTDTIHLNYSAEKTNYILPSQQPCGLFGGDAGVTMNVVNTSLNVENYYIVKPSSYLLNSFTTSSGTTADYYYTTTNNKVSKIKIKYTKDGVSSYQYYDFTYY